MTTNAELFARRANAVPRGVAHSTTIFADKAQNAELWDVEGQRYIDFAGGIGVLNVGHRHPKVMDVVTRQLAKFSHTAFQVSPYESYIELAERLNAIAPFSGPAKSVFFTTGAEAVENAVKVARAATKRSAVIAFSGAFHGRTFMASALTGKTRPYKHAFGALPGEVFRAPFPNPFYGVSVEDSLRALEMIFAADVAAENVAAIIIEPVQGEGGFNVAPPALLQALRKICDENGVLLIADEVQTGFARTGRTFAIEHSGIEPDLVVIAKSLAGGLPLSGVIGRAEILDKVEPGGLGGTYGGSPLACAAGIAVLDVIAEEKLNERADAIGARIRARLAALAERNDVVPIAGVRGLGAMIAFDVVTGDLLDQPDGPGAKAVSRRALDAGLIVLTCGAYGEAIRILVPLTASDAIVDEGMDRLEHALRA